MQVVEEQNAVFDLLVIGGGINGVGVARDAAGRGLRVCLCEKDDLAQHTSSASTKLIHGGLRYLEQYDFKLVRHALKEREVLLRSAPHIIHPMRFVLPHHRALRPRWMIRAGLFLYDHLGGRELLPPSGSIRFDAHPAGEALKSAFSAGFEYSDCWVHDARLVVLSALDAQERGAQILTHTLCQSLQRGDSLWSATLLNQSTGQQQVIRARAVVNAAGPWVEQVLKLGVETQHRHGVRFVKGSHIVVPKMFDHDYAYIFQHADGRVVFAIPYEDDFTLLGTTDIELDELPEKPTISEDEIDYICSAVNEYFEFPVNRDDVVWSFSGVRPLYDDAASDASKVTRDYNLHLAADRPPILSVYGGKITTFRRLAEEVLALLAGCMDGVGGAWTAAASLPGGDIPGAELSVFEARCLSRYSQLPAKLVRRYAELYGTRIDRLLDGCRELADLGRAFGHQLYEREVRYLVEQEFASSAEDIVWRRTKLGLGMSEDQIEQLDQWLSTNCN